MKQNHKEQGAEGQKMDYERFAAGIRDRVQQYAGDGKKVTLKDMEKNNGVSRKGLIIHGESGNTIPVIYLEAYYTRYLEGSDIDGTAREVYEAVLGSRNPAGLDLSLYRDYGWVKERILYKLVNYKMNEGLLRKVPHLKYLDLAVVFYCPLAEDENLGLASVLVRREHLGLWGITEEELAGRAYENTPRLQEHQLMDMAGMFDGLPQDGKGRECMPPGGQPSRMLVLTNRSRVNGAACILYPGLLERLAAEENASFVILPSSVHEVILVAATDSMGKDEISAYTQMVREVNRMELAEEEILSDHAYFYDRTAAGVCAA